MPTRQTSTINEKLPHQVENGTADLVATASVWHLRFTLFGPDGRYNASIKIWEARDFAKHKGTCLSAWKKFQFLVSDADTKNTKMTVDVADGISVVMNTYGRTGVVIHWHTLFADDASYRSFMSALDWCLQRGPILMEKCKALDAL